MKHAAGPPWERCLLVPVLEAKPTPEPTKEPGTIGRYYTTCRDLQTSGSGSTKQPVVNENDRMVLHYSGDKRC